MAACQSDASQQEQATEPPLPDGEIAIENPWVRPAPAGSTSALYMTVANGQQTPDTLLRIRAPIIGGSEVYAAAADTADTGDPRPVGSLEVPARTRTTLSPKGTHIRLTKLSQSFDENSSIILNLEFAQTGLQRVRVPVQGSPPTNE